MDYFFWVRKWGMEGKKNVKKMHNHSTEIIFGKPL